MSEEAKAVQEVAKSSGKAIDAGREMAKFIGRIIGGPLEQAVGIWEDRLKYARQVNHGLPSLQWTRIDNSAGGDNRCRR